MDLTPNPTSAPPEPFLGSSIRSALMCLSPGGLITVWCNYDSTDREPCDMEIGVRSGLRVRPSSPRHVDVYCGNCLPTMPTILARVLPYLNSIIVISFPVSYLRKCTSSIAGDQRLLGRGSLFGWSSQCVILRRWT